MSNYRAVERGMERQVELRHDFNVSAAECASRCAAGPTTMPSGEPNSNALQAPVLNRQSDLAAVFFSSSRLAQRRL